MTGTNSDEAPPKRMRLGTRSCAECRRRKVRCNFLENSTTCDNCALYSVVCQAQQRKPGETKSREQDETHVLKKRLDEMETILRQMYGSMSNNSAHSPSVSQNSNSAPSTTFASSPSFEGDTARTTSHSDVLEQFGHTPLVSLLKETLFLRNGSRSPDAESRSSNHPLRLLIAGFPQKIPAKDVVAGILDATKSCWPIWPPCYHGSSKLQELGVPAVLEFIFTALASEDAAAAAKAILWLALSIFELPRTWAAQYPELSDPEAIIDIYMEQARRLLSIASERGDNIHSVEALCLEARLNIDLGRPRKAWLGSRKAMNKCLLLGFHRMNARDNKREQELWGILLHTERETSLIVGLPSSISNLNKPLLPDTKSMMPLARLLYEMMVVSGSVVDRNQSQITENYARTIELDQDWEACKRLMPGEFWTAEPPTGLSFAELYLRQTTKIRFYIIGRLIHLPFVFRSKTEGRYAMSRTACLDASREIIIAYQTLRRVCGPELAPCGLMDFECFSSAVVLALDLLENMPPGGSSEVGHSPPDVQLLVGLSGTLRQAASLKDCCTVAGQAADMVDVLLSALHGSVPEGSFRQGCDIRIPFFGRLKIRFPTRVDSWERFPVVDPGSRAMAESMPPPVVEFGTLPSGQEIFFNFDLDAELSSNWSTSLEADSYDWETILHQAPTLNSEVQHWAYGA